MPTVAELKQLPRRVRRRNAWLGWAIAVVAAAIMVLTVIPVHHGWIFPKQTTYAFPKWMKK
ncbi:MAG: hypothetical protein ACRD1Y_06235 [Terriglobales bacterium]